MIGFLNASFVLISEKSNEISLALTSFDVYKTNIDDLLTNKLNLFALSMFFPFFSLFFLSLAAAFLAV